MNSRNGSSIGYTSYNLPNVINAGSSSSSISYGAFRNRYKQVSSGSVAETTIYVAGLLEKVTRGSVTEYRHLIAGGKGTAAIHTRRSDATNSTYYVQSDHLGSPELVTDSAGTVIVRLSFGAYGERRDKDWDGPVSAPDLTALANISRHGFTGHEHLDAVGLIHMNGRVYEPIVGRFLGVDPILGVGQSQDVNSYSYAWNNPLNVIDPSGLDEHPTPLGPVQVTGQSLAWLQRLLDLLRMLREDSGGAGGGAGVRAGNPDSQSESAEQDTDIVEKLKDLLCEAPAATLTVQVQLDWALGIAGEIQGSLTFTTHGQVIGQYQLGNLYGLSFGAAASAAVHFGVLLRDASAGRSRTSSYAANAFVVDMFGGGGSIQVNEDGASGSWSPERVRAGPTGSAGWGSFFGIGKLKGDQLATSGICAGD